MSICDKTGMFGRPISCRNFISFESKCTRRHIEESTEMKWSGAKTSNFHM